MGIELTVTAKGQVTLRKSVMAHLGVKPGDKLSVSMRGDGKVELGLVRKKRDLSALRGLLHRPGQPAFDIDVIEEAVAAGAVERYLRSR